MMKPALLCIRGRTRKQIENLIQTCLSGKMDRLYGTRLCPGDLTLSIVAESETDLFKKLNQASSLLKTADAIDDPAGIYFESSPYGPESLAFIFPGQGSQYPRMLSPLNSILPGFREELEDLFSIWNTIDIRNMNYLIYINESIESEKKLKDTFNGQPAIGMVSDALSQALIKAGIVPSFFAGHSYGEIAALKAAGALSRKTFLLLSRERGRLLSEAGHKAPGCMTAVLTPESRIKPLLEGITGVIAVANYNSPSQIVVSGETSAVKQFEEKCKDQQIRTVRLKTSCAFHSPLMSSVSSQWHDFLRKLEKKTDGFQSPDGKHVYSNYTQRPYPDDTGAMSENLYQQIENSVFWDRQCRNMYRNGARIFLETGPGGVLTGLNKRIFGDEPHLAATFDVKNRKQALHLVAKLAAHGIPLEWECFNNIKLTDLKPDMSKTIKQRIADYRALKSTIPDKKHGDRPMNNSSFAFTLSEPPDTSSGSIAGPTAVSSYFTGNSQVVQSFFNLQEKLVISLDPSGNSSAINQVMQNNMRIMNDFMAAQQHGMNCLCENNVFDAGMNADEPQVNPFVKSPPMRQPQEPEKAQAPVESEKTLPPEKVKAVKPVDTARPGNIDDIIQWTRTQLCNLTGFPEDIVTEEASFSNDLGLDSITLIQPIMRLIRMFPQLESQGENIRLAGSLGSLRLILSESLKETAQKDQKTADNPVESSTIEQIIRQCRRIIMDITGFPEDVVTLEADFSSELGINSISLLQIFMKLMKAYPKINKIGDELRTANCLGMLSDIIEQSGLYSRTVNEIDQSGAKSELDGALPGWEAIEQWLKAAYSQKADHPRQAIDSKTTFSEDLELTVFQKQEVINALVNKVPEISLAGSELIKADSIGELKRYITRILTHHHEKEPPFKSAGRFLIQEHRQEQPGQFDPVSVPGRLILAGKPGEHYEMFRRFLEKERCRIIELHLKKKESVYGWELSGKDSKRFFGFDEITSLGSALSNGSSNGTVPPVLIVDGIGANSIDSNHFSSWRDRVESGATSIFVLAKALLADRYEKNVKGDLFACVHCGNNDPCMRSSVGVLKSLSKELPLVNVKYLCLRDSESRQDFSRIIAELFKPYEKAKEIILDQRGLSTLVCKSSNLEKTRSAPMNINDRSVLLLTGGADGITSEIGVKLVETYKCRIVSLGRTKIAAEPSPLLNITDAGELKKAIFHDLKNRGKEAGANDVMKMFRSVKRLQAIRRNEKRIREAGGQFSYIQADVTVAEDIERAVAQIKEKFGSINGFIHGAGIIDDQMISSKTVTSFRRVLYTKAHSIYHFYHLLKDEPLEFAVLLSSITSFTGNAGQTDYAAANEILNGVAAYWNEKAGYPVKSMLWSVWGETGLAADALKQKMENSGLDTISTKEGVKLFLDELTKGAREESVVILSPDSTLNYLMSR